MSPFSTLMDDHPDWYCCYISVTHDHAMPCYVPLPLVERLVVWAYKRFLEWFPTHKKVGVCTVIAYVTGAQKRTHVDSQNMPNHHTSICLECEGCMAVKAYDSRLLYQVCCFQTYMLPRGLIWEEVTPPHINVI